MVTLMNREEVMDRGFLRPSDSELLDSFYGMKPALVGSIIGKGFLTPEDAEDIIQDVATSLFVKPHSIDSYDHRKAFEPWIYRVVKNRLLDRLRSGRRAKPEHPFSQSADGTSMNIEDSSGDPVRLISVQESRRIVEKSIGRLSTPLQETVRYRLEHPDATGKEMAAALNRQEATIRWRLSQALQQIKDMPDIRELLQQD